MRARTSYRYKAFLGKLWSDLIICHLLSPHLHPFSKACFQVYNSFQGGGGVISFFDFIDLGFFHGSCLRGGVGNGKRGGGVGYGYIAAGCRLFGVLVKGNQRKIVLLFGFLAMRLFS